MSKLVSKQSKSIISWLTNHKGFNQETLNAQVCVQVVITEYAAKMFYVLLMSIELAYSSIFHLHMVVSYIRMC